MWLENIYVAFWYLVAQFNSLKSCFPKHDFTWEPNGLDIFFPCQLITVFFIYFWSKTFHFSKHWLLKSKRDRNVRSTGSDPYSFSKFLLPGSPYQRLCVVQWVSYLLYLTFLFFLRPVGFDESLACTVLSAGEIMTWTTDCSFKLKLIGNIYGKRWNIRCCTHTHTHLSVTAGSHQNYYTSPSDSVTRLSHCVRISLCLALFGDVRLFSNDMLTGVKASKCWPETQNKCAEVVYLKCFYYNFIHPMFSFWVLLKYLLETHSSHSGIRSKKHLLIRFPEYVLFKHPSNLPATPVCVDFRYFKRFSFFAEAMKTQNMKSSTPWPIPGVKQRRRILS